MVLIGYFVRKKKNPDDPAAEEDTTSGKGNVNKEVETIKKIWNKNLLNMAMKYRDVFSETNQNDDMNKLKKLANVPPGPIISDKDSDFIKFTFIRNPTQDVLDIGNGDNIDSQGNRSNLGANVVNLLGNNEHIVSEEVLLSDENPDRLRNHSQPQTIHSQLQSHPVPLAEPQSQSNPIPQVIMQSQPNPILHANLGHNLEIIVEQPSNLELDINSQL